MERRLEIGTIYAFKRYRNPPIFAKIVKVTDKTIYFHELYKDVNIVEFSFGVFFDYTPTTKETGGMMCMKKNSICKNSICKNSYGEDYYYITIDEMYYLGYLWDKKAVSIRKDIK